MSLWDRLRDWFRQGAQHYTYGCIEEPGAEPIRANEGYFRLWLDDMFLARSRDWFREQCPSVTTVVKLQYAGSSVTLTHVARAPEEALSRAVLSGFPVTPLLPFRGGTVEIEGALLALQGINQLGAVIDVIGDFAGLIAAPISQALDIAGKVTSGLDQVVSAINGSVHLALRDAFADGEGPNGLRPRYIATILAPAGKIAKDRLSVVDGRLHYAAQAGAAPAPLTGYDYMLYRIEGRRERDDYRLPNIEEPLNKAIEATITGDDENAQAFKRVALIAALTSADLAVPDRRRVAQAIKQELADIADTARGAIAGGVRGLDAIMQARGGSWVEARNLGEMTMEEAFA